MANENTQTTPVRTRIAPSPTGQDLHIGNIYTGLLNWAYAHKNGGKFIIRIEDTDRERYISGSEERILASLKKFGLNYDEGPDIGGPFAPYRQSARLSTYKSYVEELVEKGYAYYCFCTKERLDSLRQDQISKKIQTRYDRYCLKNVTDPEKKITAGEKYVIRMKAPDNQDIVFQDVIRGEVKINSAELDDQVLLKSDGYPTYHLGVVVDDHIMEISHVIRAEEWISSTPKHILLYKFFGWNLPVFAHVPLLRNLDRSKLSKRKNPVWASWYIENGYLPEAMLNFLALLGWSHPEEHEIFSMEEFISLFDLKDINPVGPVFDINKLQWMNGIYIRERLTFEELKNRLGDFYKEDDDIRRFLESKDSDVDLIIELARTRMNTLAEFKILVSTNKVKESDFETAVRFELIKQLSTINDADWKIEKLFEIMKKILEQYKIKMPVLYKLFIGREHGLPLPEFFAALGREATLERLTK